MRHTPEVVKKAVDAEMRRGGQVFYLHNKVKTIQAVARRLNERFPKIRIAVGHGQMGENELEDVMTKFVAHQYDMLVCTTIIEAGIDIPNCNTIIIEGADRFGLSQLYQLRGRVGRFDKQAYAYLLLNSHKPVSDKARKRLSAIRQITRLGAGFRIALRDLELRGAGNLLGGEQSGHVAGVGFDLYCRLLKQSVARLKGDEKAIRSRATVRLGFTTSGVLSETDSPEPESPEEVSDVIGTYLPEHFAAETRLRIDFYRKLANAIDAKEVEEIREELADRFGELPREAKALLLETEIRCLAEEAGFDRLETEGSSLQCRFAKGKKPNKDNKFLMVAGRFPKLSEKEPFLKLKEIVRFLKLRIYAKEVE
jgi:transcription-repair coupling factor (superfamily II helicase)